MVRMATCPDHLRAESRQPLSRTERFLRRCTGDEGTGFALSLLIHGGVLLALAGLVWRKVHPGDLVAITISTVAPVPPLVTDLPLEMQLRPEQPPQELSRPPLIGALPTMDHAAELERLLAKAASDGGSGRSSRDAANDPALPKHAVRAGSFTAWWIPAPQRYGEQVEPGQLPRAEQPYHIHVQIRLPDARPVFRLDDLSGEIVGTDMYRQRIPDRAWVLDERGQLVRAAGRGHARVHNGVAEIVFKVEGAGRVGIRDTITIRSRSLREEQVLTLEFQPSAPSGE